MYVFKDGRSYADRKARNEVLKGQAEEKLKAEVRAESEERVKELEAKLAEKEGENVELRRLNGRLKDFVTELEQKAEKVGC